MGLSIVNSSPGSVAAPLIPGDAAQLGLRDDAGLVDLGSLRVSMGLSNFRNAGLLPDVDPSLSSLGMEVAYETVERRRPVTGSEPKSFPGDSLLISRASSSMSSQSVYELRTPILQGASILGYVKFKKAAWAVTNPDWCSATGMVAPYIGLEHGTHNNACYFFLQDDGGNGHAVIGGPLQSLGGVRPGQTVLDFEWKAMADGDSIELWIRYTEEGYPSPFNPPHLPVVEIWAQREGLDLFPVRLTALQPVALGSFPGPSSNFPNQRIGPSDTASLFIGNAGASGDVLAVDDWAIFPDYRVCVSEGNALAGNSLSLTPDAPIMFQASKGLTPAEGVVGIWIPTSDAKFILPACSFIYQAGKKTTPYAMGITRSSEFLSSFHKDEPRLKESESFGAMVEALLYGDQSAVVTDVFGAGLSIEDGTHAYRAILLQTPTTRTIGIQKTDIDFSTAGFYLPVDANNNVASIDWSSPKLVRLTLDRARNLLTMTVDEALVLSVATSSVFPASTASRISFGHLSLDPSPRGVLKTAFLNYLSEYYSYEGSDGVAPDSVGWGKESNNTVAFGDSAYPLSAVVDKQSYASSGSYGYYSKAGNFGDSNGFLVDFSSQVISYKGPTGEGFVSGVWAGPGIQIWLGNKILSLGFYDCGTSGRVIGLLPGSGSASDIVNQTTLGRAFSGLVDWTRPTIFRVIYRAYQSIQVWAASVSQAPLIEIPWRNANDGFDIPLGVSSPKIAFGHFNELTASKSVWDYVRWGTSSGYDVAITPQFSERPAYLFSGKSFVQAEFDE